MNDTMKIFIGLLLPLLGTVAGSSMVFFLSREMKNWLQKLLLGFASGVMIAASVWSLLIPAIDMSESTYGEGLAWLPAVVGFLLGIGFLLLLDSLIPHLHFNSDAPEGRKSDLKKSVMLVLAVTLHNLPEGMAVGVVFAGISMGDAVISTAGAFALAVGIAVQNFPEGAIISMPLISSGISRRRAFSYGVLSGIVEPAGALITLALTSFVTPVLPYILYTKGLSGMENSTASVIASIEPVTATVIGWIMFDEILDIIQIVGIVLVIGAVVFSNVSKK